MRVEQQFQKIALRKIKLIRATGVVCVVGGMAGCLRLYFTADVMTAWSMSGDFEILFGLILLLLAIGVIGYWMTHAYQENVSSSKSSIVVATLAGAFIGNGIGSAALGISGGVIFFFMGVLIIGAYCWGSRRVDRWSARPAFNAVIGQRMVGRKLATIIGQLRTVG